MKTVSLSGSPRGSVGKKDAKELRANNRVPAVLYGGDEQMHFSVAETDIEKVVFTPDVFLFTLDVDGKKVEAVLVDIQFHPVTDRVIHVDFLEVIEGKPVRLKLPVQTTGNAIGVKNGGRLLTNYRRVTVMGLPKDFPDVVELDVTKLRIGQALRMKDIVFPGVTLLHDPEAVVVSVKTARGAIEDELEDEEGEEGEEGEGGEGGEGSEGGDGAEAKTEETAAE